MGLLQLRMRCLQPAGHIVELIGKRLELVTRGNRNTFAQFTSTDPFGAGAERPDREHHPPCKIEAGENGEEEGSREQHTRARKRGIQRRIGFADRQFHEYEPVERCDRGVRRQHLLPFNVTARPARARAQLAIRPARPEPVQGWRHRSCAVRGSYPDARSDGRLHRQRTPALPARP